MKKILSAGIVLPGFFVSAQNPGLSALSARADVFSFQNNPASLAGLKYTSAGVAHERPFLLPDVSRFYLAVALPSQYGNFGLIANYAGLPLYHETEAGLVYARSVGKKADAGVQFNYYRQQVHDYGSTSIVLPSLGVLFHLTDQLRAGIRLYNPFCRKPPPVYSFGLGYNASERFFAGIQVEKQQDQPVNIIAGFEYGLLSRAKFSMGMQSAIGGIYAGVDYIWRASVIRFVTSFHPQLGITPMLSLIMNGKK